MWSDVRYGWRTLWNRPWFTVVAAITLALGIQAATVMYSVAKVLVFRPVPLPDMERLVVVAETAPVAPGEWTPSSPANFLDWKRQSSSFEALAAYSYRSVNLTGAGEPEFAQAAAVAADFFRVARVSPALGRTFLAEEEGAAKAAPGSDRVVILGYGLWQRRFGGDARVVGSEVKLDGVGHTVVGVMPADFELPVNSDLWLPLIFTSQSGAQRGSHYLWTIARLKPGVSISQAGAEMSAIGKRLEQAYPGSNARWGVMVAPLRDFITGAYTKRYIFLLLGSVVFLLLICCANVANLQLARATSRQKEIAIRSCIGASGWRLVRQLLTESVLLSLIGAGIGLLMAQWALEPVRSNMPPDIARFLPGWKNLRLDTEALIVTITVAVLSGLLSGLAPVFHAVRPDLNEALKEGGGRGGDRSRSHKVRDALVVAEVALALVLLVGAGLMVRGFNALLDQGARFRPDELLTMRLVLPASKYKTEKQRAEFASQALARITALAGVRAAGFTSTLPYTGGGANNWFTIEGMAPPQPGEWRTAMYQPASASYFQALNLPVVRGRGFAETDGAEAPRVAVISEQLAAKFLSGQDPIGKRIKLGLADSPAPWMVIVGVAAEVQHTPYDRTPRLALYVPLAQFPQRSMDLIVRAEGDPMALVPAVRAQIAGVDPDQPLSRIKVFARQMKEELTALGYVAAMMTVYGAIALMLACVGIYGVMAYAVSERTHEIGVRVALGASEASVLRMVIGRGMLMAGAGFLIGLPVAFLLARMLAGLVFGVTAADPATYIGFSLVLACVAGLAAWIPARRALRVDPVVALRHE